MTHDDPPALAGLRDLINRLQHFDALRDGSEALTRQVAVTPILEDLGWDSRNPDEVFPEYSVGAGRVDYCLQLRGEPHVFIEVKRPASDLGAHQKQLLTYAFAEGVPLAALTDGLVWWLYLPTFKGSWEQRKFFSVDIRRVEPQDAAQDLSRFLARTVVQDGTAEKRASEELNSRERVRRIDGAFPLAWSQLLTEPDELIAEILMDAVEGIAGARPDADSVTEFLLQADGTPPLEVTPAAEPRPAERHGRAETPSASPVPRTPYQPSGYTGKRPIAFLLSGTRHQVTSWRNVLREVLAFLSREHREVFSERVVSIRGKKRPYFSEDADELRDPLEIEGSALYVEGNLSANDIVKLVEKTVAAVLGFDARFEIEATDKR